MKDSHFELPRSQYMENQSQRSRQSALPKNKHGEIIYKGCSSSEASFDINNNNGEDTNEGSTAGILSPPKKTISWEQVLQECEYNNNYKPNRNSQLSND